MADSSWIVKEIVPPDTELVFVAMAQLRTKLRSIEGFVNQVDTVQRPYGYRIVAILPSEGAKALAVAVFRFGISLSWGRHLYVEDF